MQKFIIDPNMKDGQNVRIMGQDARHIRRVLRLKPGDPLSMTDGKGMDCRGEIISMDANHVRVQIIKEEAASTESPLNLILCTAMLKHKKMDEIIKQATQLGVTQWVPFYSSRSVPQSNPKKEARQMERWETIARESLKQCRRGRLVTIVPPTSFETVLDMARGASHKIAFWEEGGLPLNAVKAGRMKTAVILIGPEGGFTVSEIQKAEKMGFRAFSLGPRILRAETAALSGACLVQYLLGDMGG